MQMQGTQLEDRKISNEKRNIENRGGVLKTLAWSGPKKSKRTANENTEDRENG